MKKIIFTLVIAIFSSNCTADARVLAELLAKAHARHKVSVLKNKKPKKKIKQAMSIQEDVKLNSKQIIAKKNENIVTSEELEVRGDLAYLPNQDKPFTGKHRELHSNKKKYIEADYRDGKKNGSLILWDEYEHKVGQLIFINGRYQEN